MRCTGHMALRISTETYVTGHLRINTETYVTGHMVLRINTETYVTGHMVLRINTETYVTGHMALRINTETYVTGHMASVLIQRRCTGATLTKLSGLFGMPSGFCSFLSEKRGGWGKLAAGVEIFSLIPFGIPPEMLNFAAIPRGLGAIRKREDILS